ncbi:MAG TPA: site-specific DNA-methyltransferase, partial [Acidimicrobiales bacterium]|nr:site-specific DNA-methyltransferase [Acidimicrobiales bacterium]
MSPRKPTATSNFGVGKREGHDAAAFYARFQSPELDPDDTVLPALAVQVPVVCGDARQMTTVADGTVALVVTSPPYFAGKQYEEELDREGIPSSYIEYLELLRDVFAECRRCLEPGGRIAVNVANLGRRPYRSLSSDVIRILQDDLHLLLRGEIIWRKGAGASGSCAWGSFRKAANPVLRDLTERVVVASKGRFDRAMAASDRQRLGLPHESTSSSDEFMAATLDVWEMMPESATRVGHPAPFPVALPERLIRLYTYAGDLVLDPFVGAGSTLVAAAQLGRRFVGYDLDPAYVEITKERLAGVSAGQPEPRPTPTKAIQAVAADVLEAAGFRIIGRNSRLSGLGVAVSLAAVAADDVSWYFDVSGGFTTTPAGLHRTETALASLGRAHVLARNGISPVVFLTSHMPRRSSEPDLALRAAGTASFFDAIELLSEDGQARLSAY